MRMGRPQSDNPAPIKRGGLPEEQRAVVREAAAQPADGVEGLHHFIQRFGDGDDVESGSDVGIVVVRVVRGTQEAFLSSRMNASPDSMAESSQPGRAA